MHRGRGTQAAAKNHTIQSTRSRPGGNFEMKCCYMQNKLSHLKLETPSKVQIMTNTCFWTRSKLGRNYKLASLVIPIPSTRANYFLEITQAAVVADAALPKPGVGGPREKSESPRLHWPLPPEAESA
jgi:hypothetical protein